MSDTPHRIARAAPGLGHNHPPEPIGALDLHLSRTHRELVVRFIDLELGCARVPDPLLSEDDAATTTDFIAQGQSQIKKAEAAHKQEKIFFQSGPDGRRVFQAPLHAIDQCLGTRRAAPQSLSRSDCGA